MNDAPRFLQGLTPFRIVGAVTPFHRMRLVATLLLAACALAWVAILVAWPRLPGDHLALGYARAFFEAAMIGGLADWFAVTALFRRPLGLPIPHTAIIPSNKDRIGDSLALFLKDNFLTPSVVARRLEGIGLAAALGRWLVAPVGPADVKAGRLRKALSKLLLQFADAVDGETAARLLAVTVTDGLRDRPVAPMLARLLRPLVTAGRHEAVVEALLVSAMTIVDARQEDIHAAVAARAPKYMPGFVDRGYSRAFIDGVQEHLFAMTEDAADIQRRDALTIAQGFRERLAAHEGSAPPRAARGPARARPRPSRPAGDHRLAAASRRRPRGSGQRLPRRPSRRRSARCSTRRRRPRCSGRCGKPCGACSRPWSTRRRAKGAAASRGRRARWCSAMPRSPTPSIRWRGGRRSASSPATAMRSCGWSATPSASGTPRP